MIFINHNLQNIFSNISKLGWIPVPERGYGANGLLFENLLGIRCNGIQGADYMGIELKVKSVTSEYPLTLFSLCFNDRNYLELSRFVNSYGAKDKVYNVKTMSIKINATSFTFWGKNLKFKLICDRRKKRLYILVSHSNGKVIEKKCFWNFESIESITKKKLNTLCIVDCNSKLFYDFKFLRFESIYFYKFINFDNFIDAIEDGSIFIKIKCGIHKKGKLKGTQYYHGIEFQICYKDLYKIFY